MSDREARFKRLLQQERRKNRQLTTALEQAVEQIEVMGDYETLKAENEQLLSAITEGAYRAEFAAAAEKAGIDPRYIDDLWKVAPPEIDPEKDPDPKAMLKHVKEAAKGRRVLKRDEDEEDDEDREEEDQDDDETEDSEEEDDGISLFDDDDDESDEDEAPPMKPSSKATAKPAKGQPAGKPAAKDAAPPKNGKPSKPAPKLTKGEGAGRGSRDDHKADDFYTQVDKDFAATGRTDPYRI